MPPSLNVPSVNASLANASFANAFFANASLAHASLRIPTVAHPLSRASTFVYPSIIVSRFAYTPFEKGGKGDLLLASRLPKTVGTDALIRETIRNHLNPQRDIQISCRYTRDA